MDKIICLGKNYIEHAKEMGDGIPEKPVLFLKPPSVLRTAEKNSVLALSIPPDVGMLHHECEIVLRLSSGGYRMNRDQAIHAIEAVGLGLDMTLRDKQAALKKAGQPWTVSKVFLDSAVVGPFLSVAEFPNYLDEPFSFSLDGKVRQKGRGKEMTLLPVDAVVYASECFPLSPGDLVFTGTPAGVNSVQAGQTATLSWGPRYQYQVRWDLYQK